MTKGKKTDIISASLISQSEVFNKQLQENEAHTFEGWIPIYRMVVCTLPHLSVSAKQYISARLLLRSVDICISTKAKKRADAAQNEAVIYDKAQIGIWPALLGIPKGQNRDVDWKDLKGRFTSAHNLFQAAYKTRKMRKTVHLDNTLTGLRESLSQGIIPKFEEFAPDRPLTASGSGRYEDGVRRGSSSHVRSTSRQLTARDPQITQSHMRRKEPRAQTPPSGHTRPHEGHSQRRYWAWITESVRFFRGLRTRGRPSRQARSARPS